MAIAYKLFKYRRGKLYPLYIDTTTAIPIGVPVIAQPGPRTESGKVRSKLGELAYRPGWHLTEIPLADHIGKRQPDGRLFQAKDTVWCEVEYADQIDYNRAAQSRSTNKRDQCLRCIPVNGFYWYQTNPNAKVRWIIAGAITVKRILSNAEVADLCHAAGYEPQPLEGGKK